MRILPRLSLQYRIAVGVILGLAVLLSVFGFFAVRAIGQSKEVALAERQRLAETTAASVDALIQHTIDQLDAAAGLAATAPGTCGYDQIQPLFHVLGTFDTISCVDAAGRTLWTVPSTGRPAGGGFADDPRFAEVIQLGETKIVQLASPDEGHPPIAIVASPLSGPEGGTSAVLLAELHLSHMGSALVALPRQAESVNAEIVDARGFIIARADGGEVVEAEQHAETLQDLIVAGRSGTKIHDDHVVAYEPLDMIPGGVVIEQHEDQALAVPKDLQRTAIIFGVGAILVASVAAWFHARSVVKPIRDLTDASGRIAAGALDDPIIVTRDDEVGTLARSFETMRVRLRDSREQQLRWEKELEERVRQRTEELQRRNRELAALNDIAASVSRSLDPETIMSTSLDKVLDTMRADAGSILLADGNASGKSLGAHRGLPEGSEQGCLGDVVSNCPCDRAIQTGEAVLVEGGTSLADDLHETCGARLFASSAAVPLRAKDRALGVLLVHSRRPRHIGSQDMELLSAIGNTVGVAVENALLHGELREKEEVRTHLLNRVISAQEEERKRIARELHDESAQLLATLLVEIGTAENLLPATADRARGILSRAKTDASRALTGMRQMILDLRPSALDDLGLVAAVQWYANTRLEQVGAKVHLNMDGSRRRLAASMETALFRIAQEAINNVAKHSSATTVNIGLRFTDSAVSLTVEDDGNGFDAMAVARDQNSGGGLGLLGMKERAALLGGHAAIESQPGRGTRIAVDIPLEK